MHKTGNRVIKMIDTHATLVKDIKIMEAVEQGFRRIRDQIAIDCH